MKELIIAVDCDDVLVPSTPFIVEEYNRLYGTEVKLSDAHVSGNPQWKAEKSVNLQRIHDIQLSDAYAQVAPFAEAIEAITRLARKHELHFVSARADSVMPTTKRMLEMYFPDMFQTVVHVGPSTSKAEACLAVKASILIDDNVKHLDNTLEAGITHGIWFGDYPWQARQQTERPVVRCKDWSAVEKAVEDIAHAGATTR